MGCRDCIYRLMNDDGTKTIVDGKGNCFCDIQIKDRCAPTDSCTLYRQEDSGEHDTREILEIVKLQPIQFVEDVFLHRKLSNMERSMVEKFIKKYYPAGASKK